MPELKEPLIPVVGVVTDIRIDTPDVKTFRVVTPDGKKAFEHKPGQCAMLSIPGVGEAMFSITSSPTNEEYMEFSIKKCGCVTEWLHSMEVGQEITIRGPYGHPFPVDTEFVGKDMLFIAGGIGLAPLRRVINYIRHYRKKYGKVVVVYGARSKDDLVDIDEIKNEWENEPDFEVYLTIDRPQDGWDGHVGFVPAYVKELGLDPTMTAVLCGPPIMIKFTLAGLLVPVCNPAANGFPLGAEADEHCVKYLFLDSGLLLAILGMDFGNITSISEDILIGNAADLVNKGHITEMVAGLEIIKNQQPDNVPSLYFWMREARGALAEVDYILAKDMKILPIEVKAEVKGGMKSLYSFVEAKGITHAVRTSLENFGRFTKGDCVIDIYPLYALQNLVGT